ncbi:MAG: hypothetical protein RIQ46_1658 [Pseudomonadota bacterium]
MNRSALPALALVLAAPALLGGCAAALVPVVAGGVMARKQLDGDEARSGERRAEATAGAELSPPPPERIPVFTAEPALKSGPATNAALRVPAASPPSGDDPYAAFARHAVEAGLAARDGTRLSALVDQDSLTGTPRLAACAAQPPAVLIDLDAGSAPFDLENPPLAAPGLAERLATLRSSGITVLWSASLPAAAAERLYTILQATGLDPQRTDRLLLLRPGQDRKQQRREAAAQDWCIVAIAGDRRADFDEAFDYLRDPQGPVARALESHFGAGWFLAPPPID